SSNPLQRSGLQGAAHSLAAGDRDLLQLSISNASDLVIHRLF
ncbi:hypothetical protein JMJ77_0010322, partial [Colletotrichum scovillei]